MNTKNEKTKKPFTKPTIEKMNVLGGAISNKNESYSVGSSNGSKLS